MSKAWEVGELFGEVIAFTSKPSVAGWWQKDRSGGLVSVLYWGF